VPCFTLSHNPIALTFHSWAFVQILNTNGFHPAAPASTVFLTRSHICSTLVSSTLNTLGTFSLVGRLVDLPPCACGSALGVISGCVLTYNTIRIDCQVCTLSAIAYFTLWNCLAAASSLVILHYRKHCTPTCTVVAAEPPSQHVVM
jgi:hypothetical protein